MFEWTSFGRIKFSGKVYECDVVVGTDHNARPRDKTHAKQKYGTSHVIDEEEVESILDPDCEALVVGTGQNGAAGLTPEAKKLLEERGIEYYELPTPEAIKKYNEIFLRKRTVALMHVTC